MPGHQSAQASVRQQVCTHYHKLSLISSIDQIKQARAAAQHNSTHKAARENSAWCTVQDAATAVNHVNYGSDVVQVGSSQSHAT